MPLKVYKRGGTYHYRGTVAKRRLRGSTGASDKATAERVAAEIEARAWKGNLDGPAAVLTFAQAAIMYIEAGKPTRFLKPISGYWKDKLVKDITPGAIRQSARVLYPTQGPATRNRQVIVPTQAIINHAAESELCPRIRVTRFPVSRKEKRPVSWEWIQAFMKEASPHLGALACFMFLTGARISEALAIRWRDVDFQSRRVLIKQTKVGSERWAHIPQPLLVAMANLPRDKTVFRYTSPAAARQPWANAVKRAKIEALTFHCCRHGFATAMLQAGVDPVTVAKRGGWKTPAHVFATYGHALDDATVTDRLIGSNLTQQAADRHSRKASNDV